MIQKIHELGHAIGSYIVYGVAFCISLVTGELSSIDLLPQAVDVLTVAKNVPVADTDIFVVSEGYLTVLGLRLTELLQIVILLLTITLTFVKGCMDLKNYYHPERRARIFREWRSEVNERRDYKD